MMNTETEITKPEAPPAQSPVAKAPVKPTNPAVVKKAISMAKEMRKVPDTSKADVARKMFETIADEPREIIVQAFVEGAELTPKGAQTYFYNCRRKVKHPN
jgi:galactose-1-phosphate uridylyltransferase